MGRFSHEQEASAAGGVYLTDDRGDAQFIYQLRCRTKKRDLTTGELYGLAFDRRPARGRGSGR